MDIEKKIKRACIHSGVTQRQIAEQLGAAPQNFNAKMKRQTLTPSDLEQIARAMGAEFVCVFRFPDGTEI